MSLAPCGKAPDSVGRECYERRIKAHCVDVLGWVDAQVPADVERISAILDHLDRHHCDDLLLFMLAHPRWELVSQPKYAASLNVIEPWWKVLRS